MNVIPTLADLVEHSGRVSDVPLEAIPALRGKLKELDAALELRVALAASNGNGESREGDRLLSVTEAARKLGKSKDALYRHADQFPFVVRDGRQLRFSEKGIERYIRQRMGR